MTDAILYYNPVAGRRPLSQTRLCRLLEWFAAEGVRCTPLASEPGVSGAERPNLSGHQLIIVHGGDGTINQALQMAVPARLTMAILPAGTANVLARELGLPLDLEKAAEIAVHGRRRRICLGEADGRYFHLMVGVGLDGLVIQNLNRRLKKTFGVGAFWASGLASFPKYPLEPFEVILDGKPYDATFAVVANARNYGGSLHIAPAADLSVPYLDACLFQGRTRWRYVRYLLAAFRGSHVRFSDVKYLKVRTAEIPALRDLPVQMDGEVVGRLPVRLRIYEPGIEIMMP